MLTRPGFLFQSGSRRRCPYTAELARSASKRMPMRLSCRRTTTAGFDACSASITNVNRAGMPTGEVTSSIAPVAERFRTVQWRCLHKIVESLALIDSFI